MKKIFPILLLLLLLFNWFGYRLLFVIIQNEADIRLEQQLDGNSYDHSQLVSIKVPVVYLPYFNNSMDFERVDGEIEIQGIPYKYVERRIFQDSMELLCIPNHAAIKWQSAENVFFKFTNNLKQERKSASHPGMVKVFSIDYFSVHDGFDVACLAGAIMHTEPRFDSSISSRYLFTAAHPPEHRFLL